MLRLTKSGCKNKDRSENECKDYKVRNNIWATWIENIMWENRFNEYGHIFKS